MKSLGFPLIAFALILVSTITLMPKFTSASQGAGTTTVTEELRKHVLSGKAKDFGIDAASLPNGVWGIVMDTRYPEGPATVVALADGSASLYLGSGSGVIGGGAHESVRTAAKAAIAVAAKQIRLLHVTTDFSMPTVAHTRLLYLTPSGVYASDSINEETLGNNQHQLSTVFYAVQNVITALRLAGGDAR